jgi:hypothetical protein
MADHRTAMLEVGSLLEARSAGGSGAIRFRPDGSVDDIDVRGTADGEPFAIRFDNGASVGAVRNDTTPIETGTVSTRAHAPDWPWANPWSVVDATRRGRGVMKQADGREVRFERARLTLGANEEFMLVLEGKRPAEFGGVWRGELESGPVRLQLREAMDQFVGGVGRAWMVNRDPDGEWTFARVELDGWDDHDGDAFTLFFEADRR